MSRKAGDRLKKTMMPKRFDGKGVVWFQCSETAFYRMQMFGMPAPDDYGEVEGTYIYIQRPPKGMGADSVRYRVVWPALPGDTGTWLPTTSFTLSGNHCNETLFVLAEYMRGSGVQFVKLANKHGNGFKDSRLFGGY